MNTDSYFEIGHSHKVCEDYALSGVKDGMGYAIVSDGCSSSKDTDVGARLLAHIARDALLYLHSRKLLYDQAFLRDTFRATFEEIVIKKCLEVRDTLKLSYDLFDATLLVAAGIKDSYQITLAWGDGYIIFKRLDGCVDVLAITYESNAPYYLSYELSQNKRDAYAAEYGSGLLETNFTRVGMFTGNYSSTRDIMRRSFYEVSSDPIEQIILSSDGIGTYEYTPTPPSTESIKCPVLEMIPDIVSYKNPVGEFVTRRMNALKKDHQKRGIIHQDDVSCAAINFL